MAQWLINTNWEIRQKYFKLFCRLNRHDLCWSSLITLILLWAQKRIKLLLDGWNYLISPTPLWGPRIKIVTGKLEVQTCAKSFEDILNAVICLWYIEIHSKIKLCCVLCHKNREDYPVCNFELQVAELLWSASRKYIMCYRHSRIWLFQGASLSFSLRSLGFFWDEKQAGCFQFWIWDWPWISKTCFEMWIFISVLVFNAAPNIKLSILRNKKENL